MGLHVHVGVHPFEPAVQAFSHPPCSFAWALGAIRRAQGNIISVRFMLARKRIESAEENDRERIVAGGEAVHALHQPMEGRVCGVPEHAQKSALSLTGLHAKEFGGPACYIRFDAFIEDLAQPRMDHEGIERKAVLFHIAGKSWNLRVDDRNTSLLAGGRPLPKPILRVHSRSFLSWSKHGQRRPTGTRLSRFLTFSP